MRSKEGNYTVYVYVTSHFNRQLKKIKIMIHCALPLGHSGSFEKHTFSDKVETVWSILLLILWETGNTLCINWWRHRGFPWFKFLNIATVPLCPCVHCAPVSTTFYLIYCSPQLGHRSAWYRTLSLCRRHTNLYISIRFWSFRIPNWFKILCYWCFHLDDKFEAKTKSK